MQQIGALLALTLSFAGAADAQPATPASSDTQGDDTEEVDEVGPEPRLDARLRYEVFDPTAFGNGPQDDDGYWLWRIAPSILVPLDEHWTFGGQLYAAGAVGRNGGARPTDRNDLDVTQAWIEWRPERTGGSFVRVGRQEIALGSGRLLAASDVSNTRRRFDGLNASWRWGDVTLVGVAVAPVAVGRGVFDDASDAHTTLVGAGILAPLQEGSQLAGYVASSRREAPGFGAPGNSERTTVGVRWFYRGPKDALELEILGQDGTAGVSDTRGWAVAGEASTALPSLGMATPRVSMKVSAASGDDNPDDDKIDRFDPLFANLTYTGSVPLFGPTNLAAINPGISLTWPDGARLGVDVSVMRRVEAADTAWTFAGTPILANATGGQSIGALWAATGQLPLDQNLSLSFTLARFVASRSFAPQEPDTNFIALSLVSSL